MRRVFAELLAVPGVTEELVLGSRFGFLAFHGGSLERMTDTIAREAADRASASLYVVRQPEDLRWHVPSKLVDPAASPALTRFVHHVSVAVAVHGFGRPTLFSSLLLGGRNRGLAAHLADHLRPALPDYEVIDDLARVPRALRGTHDDNPVNRTASSGVQLELPPRVRGLGPHWVEHRGPGLTPHTEALVQALAAAAMAWSPEAGAGPSPAA